MLIGNDDHGVEFKPLESSTRFADDLVGAAILERDEIEFLTEVIPHFAVQSRHADA